MKASVMMQAGLALFLMSAATFAQPAALPAPVCGDSAEVQLLPPLTPEPVLRGGGYPPPGNAIFYGSTQQPNCVWTCLDGSVGSQQVTSEIRCRQACRPACGLNDMDCFLL